MEKVQKQRDKKTELKRWVVWETLGSQQLTTSPPVFTTGFLLYSELGFAFVSNWAFSFVLDIGSFCMELGGDVSSFFLLDCKAINKNSWFLYYQSYKKKYPDMIWIPLLLPCCLLKIYSVDCIVLFLIAQAPKLNKWEIHATTCSFLLYAFQCF